jgi:hypothetical protein
MSRIFSKNLKICLLKFNKTLKSKGVSYLLGLGFFAFFAFFASGYSIHMSRFGVSVFLAIFAPYASARRL